MTRIAAELRDVIGRYMIECHPLLKPVVHLVQPAVHAVRHTRPYRHIAHHLHRAAAAVNSSPGVMTVCHRVAVPVVAGGLALLPPASTLPPVGGVGGFPGAGVPEYGAPAMVGPAFVGPAGPAYGPAGYGVGGYGPALLGLGGIGPAFLVPDARSGSGTSVAEVAPAAAPIVVASNQTPAAGAANGDTPVFTTTTPGNATTGSFSTGAGTPGTDTKPGADTGGGGTNTGSGSGGGGGGGQTGGSGGGNPGGGDNPGGSGGGSGPGGNGPGGNGGGPGGSTVDTPEPASATLLLGGIAAALLARSRRRRRQGD